MLRYKGGGFIRGVPARDLKDDEVQVFGIHYLLRSGLYELVKPEPEKEPDGNQEESAPAAETTEEPKRRRRSKKEN